MEEAVTVLKSSTNQQALKKLMVSMSEQIRDYADLICVIKHLVNKLPDESKRDYLKTHTKEMIKDINGVISMIEKHPAYLDEFLYTTERQIFSNKDKRTMRGVDLWRSAAAEEYKVSGTQSSRQLFFFLIFFFACL